MLLRCPTHVHRSEGAHFAGRRCSSGAFGGFSPTLSSPHLSLFFITTGLKLLNLNVIHDFSVPFVKFRGGKADSLPVILTRYAEFPSKTSWSTHGLKGTTQNKL